MIDTVLKENFDKKKYKIKINYAFALLLQLNVQYSISCQFIMM